MDPVVHQPIKRRINQTVAPDRQQSGERGADDAHMEMALALPRMSGMQVAFVDDFQLGRRQCLGQTLADLREHRFTHAGKALRNGLICTSA
jgi:hypothetical protein